MRKKIFTKLVQKRILKGASAIHAITEEEVKNIKDFGIEDIPIVTIPNGINLQEFQILPPKDELVKLYPELKGKKIILFLGRVHPIKGLDLLARAFGKIIKEMKDVYLLVVGPDKGGYKLEIEKILKEDRALSQVIFASTLTGYKKLIALGGADIFVLPSYSEGFSMAVLEAMVCGLPVIITKSCNFPQVEISGAGKIINTDLESLSKVLLELLMDPDLCKEMGNKGRQLVLERYTWDKISEQMLEVYERILNSKNKQGRVC